MQPNFNQLEKFVLEDGGVECLQATTMLTLSVLFVIAEGTGVEEYNRVLPPPPMLPASYATDTLDSNTAERV